jgi:hypothetical protein
MCRLIDCQRRIQFMLITEINGVAGTMGTCCAACVSVELSSVGRDRYPGSVYVACDKNPRTGRYRAGVRGFWTLYGLSHHSRDTTVGWIETVQTGVHSKHIESYRGKLHQMMSLHGIVDVDYI